MDKFSYIANADTAAIEDLYQSYLQDTSSVDATWQDFFKGFEFSQTWGETGKTTNKPITVDPVHSAKEVSVASLIKAFRSRGHLISKTNPVRDRKDRQPRIGLKDYGLTDSDLDTVFECGNLLGIGAATLRTIMAALEKIYAGHIGFEYMYIREIEVKNWLRNKIEKEALAFNPSITEKTRILQKLNEAVVFENFLGTKYLGQKRFSLEGGETTIPALDAIINKSAEMGVKEVMIGMAHRGRLNVLVNIMHKSYESLFAGFEGEVPEGLRGDGDVKYHLGYSSKHVTPDNIEINLKLAPNPSHLETVNPVVEGFCRAIADGHYNGDYDKVLPILIHGDAAVAGQGIVYEVTQMAKLQGYTTGGTVHFVINNQVGFTTDFEDARSSIYCSDVAKIIDAPIFHVNGDDPEAVVFAAKMAVEFREQFNRDVFIDMVCYRRHGHNEADEPRFTQPTLYKKIDKHLNIRELYHQQLVSRGEADSALAAQMDTEFKAFLQDRQNKVKQKEVPAYIPLKLDQDWASLRYAEPEDFDKSPATGITKETFDKIMRALTALPDTFKPLKQISNLIAERKKMLENGQVTWAMAELASYASMLLEGKVVRLSGQDVQRGTFSHRHVTIHDSDNNSLYTQINHIEEGQEQLQAYNSLLSEYGVLGFEYGYAMANPNALVIWEAQFGDFANGAQIMIDQFLAAAESKWGIQNGMVMLLPHGYEGQGPEHSNARPERFLQLTGEYNMVVANVTTPANIFHLMRRQLAWEFRKPTVVMSPKSLFRHKLCVSSVDELLNGSFQEIYGDTYANPKKVKRVLMCTGKVYYDLLQKQQDDKREDVAIIRVEQLHPLPTAQIEAELAKYGKKVELIWVQEEPKNMGYYTYMVREFGQGRMDVVGRKISASPASGFLKVHNEEQKALIEQAFA
jgi:2-oxoglutarate dehydrogenase E1 component